MTRPGVRDGSVPDEDLGMWCSRDALSRAEPMPGSAPEAHTWIAVESPGPWGAAPLARSGHGVRVLMVRGPRHAGRTAGMPQPSAADGSPPGGGVRVWVAHVGTDPVLRVGRLDTPDEVAGWDLAAVAAGSMRHWGSPEREALLLVCANGHRDRCCGHLGGRLADELWRGEHRARVLTSTHLGGHRFAPTALLLPAGAMHGRLDAGGAAGLLDQARTGRTPAATLRGFSGLSEPAQVADVQARLLSGDSPAAPLKVEIQPGEDGDHATAHIGLTAGRSPAGPPLGIPLRRRSVTGVRSCGRAPESAMRWTLA